MWQVLIAQGADIEVKGEQQQTSLMVACMKGHAAVAEVGFNLEFAFSAFYECSYFASFSHTERRQVSALLTVAFPYVW